MNAAEQWIVVLDVAGYPTIVAGVLVDVLENVIAVLLSLVQLHQAKLVEIHGLNLGSCGACDLLFLLHLEQHLQIHA